MVSVGLFLHTILKMKTMTEIHEEVMKLAQPTGTQWEVANEVDNKQQTEIQLMLHYLAPWIEKTGGKETIGYWEERLPGIMMEKILMLLLLPHSRRRVEKIMKFYHPVDRAALAYAVVVFVLTGHRMKFKSVVAQRHYDVAIGLVREDFPGLPFVDHLKFFIAPETENRKFHGV